jgi:hypothetical protein
MCNNTTNRITKILISISAYVRFFIFFFFSLLSSLKVEKEIDNLIIEKEGFESQFST